MRQICVFIAIVLCFSACRDKVICSAFQSTYILDDSVRSTYYSYLWQLDENERTTYLSSQANLPVDSVGIASTDSMEIGGPVFASTSNQADYWAYTAQYKVPEREVKKNKFGMVKYEPYWLKNYRHRTAPMENVLTPPDPEVLPLDTISDIGEFLASDFTDSLAIDSMSLAGAEVDSLGLVTEDSFSIPSFPPIARMAPPKEKAEIRYLYGFDPKDELLNVEQQYYNKYFGDQLYVKLVKREAPKDTASTAGISSIGDFFKNLFKKKQKNQTDSLMSEEPAPILEEEPAPTEEEPEDAGEDNDGN